MGALLPMSLITRRCPHKRAAGARSALAEQRRAAQVLVRPGTCWKRDDGGSGISYACPRTRPDGGILRRKLFHDALRRGRTANSGRQTPRPACTSGGGGACVGREVARHRLWIWLSARAVRRPVGALRHGYFGARRRRHGTTAAASTGGGGQCAGRYSFSGSVRRHRRRQRHGASAGPGHGGASDRGAFIARRRLCRASADGPPGC